MIGLTRTLFSTVGPIFPAAAAHAGLRLFYSPRRKPPQKIESTFKERATRSVLGTKHGDIVTWLWGERSAPKVLLVDGWESRATRLFRFVDPILARGYAVAAFDGPAHGESDGRMTTLPKFADVLSRVYDEFDDTRLVVAHSFGCGATAMAMNSGTAFERAVFISSPYSVANVVEHFGRYMRIPRGCVSRMHELMESPRCHDLPRERLSFETLGAAVTIPTLFIHDTGDQYVAHEDGKKAAAACPNADFVSTTKLGHSHILMDKRVIERTITHLFN